MRLTKGCIPPSNGQSFDEQYYDHNDNHSLATDDDADSDEADKADHRVGFWLETAAAA